MQHVRFPIRIDGRGRTSTGSYEQHVEDMLEQLLFTHAGERVNRPDFGGGLLQMVFAAGGDQLAAATQFMVAGSIQQWLGDLLQVESVDVSQDDSTLSVSVSYTLRKTQQQQTSTFTRSN